LEITEPLIFQRALLIVDLADELINPNELIIHKEENLIILACPALSSLDSHILQTAYI
jgi:hypothetical protein